ncbi:MAG: T9SS type A sorting domain-containing protein [Candidatus Kapaibacterium sp.]|jgi:hypothetical protein
MRTLILVLGMLWLGTNAISQSFPPCDPGCTPSGPWTYGGTLGPYTALGGCQFNVEYWYRYCNGYIQLGIGTITTNGHPDCQNALTLIPTLALYKVVENNPLVQLAIDTLGNGNCITSIKASTVACFKWVPGGGPTNPNEHTVACSDTACCLYEFEICRDTNGDLNSPYPSNDPTTNVNCPSNDTACKNFCGFFDAKYGDYGETKQLVPSQADLELTLQPNPSSGVFALKLASVTRGDYSFRLFDVTGQLVYDRNITATNSTLTRDIDMSRNDPGVYIYQLIRNNQVLKTGNLSIAR